MEKLFTALKKIAFLLLMISVVSGCGTGGLSDPPASSPGSGTGGGTTGKGSITFTFVKSSDPNMPATAISPDSPVIVKATAKDSTGAVIAGKVMSFSSKFDIRFSPGSGTALTDSGGTAVMTVMVGATAGAATITASISDNAGTVITSDTGITVNLQAPPEVPTGVTVMVTSQSQISLSWTASAGAAGYKIFKNGTLLGAVATTAVVDSGLTASTQYCYSITAADASGNESAKSSTVCGMTLPTLVLVPSSIDLLVSSPQLNSDGASTVTLTAVVKDTGNRVLSGQAVSFTADSGTLTVTNGTTDANGTATATLRTGGDRTNRTINLTASTVGITAVNTVAVTGTTLSISGAASLSFGDTAPLTIFLKDSAGIGIAGKAITLTSLKGNTLSAATAVTNASGQATVNITVAVGGADKITASAIGATKDFDLTVNTAILKFINPPLSAVTEIPIETDRSVTVEYMSGGIPQAGVAVTFFTTRGALSSSSATTGADGRATITLSSTNSGPALLQAAIAAGPSSQVAVEFVAPTVFSLTLQASPVVVGTNSGGLENEKSLITAVVRDKNNNLVKNKTVSFTIVLDASAGRLSPASAITDSFGAANTYFIAGASPGGLDGVTIRASVMGTTVSATTRLTVAKKALFIALATGPTIAKVEPNKYQKDYVALVTDSAGNPVSGATVVATVTPMYYQKGYYKQTFTMTPSGPVFDRWQQVPTLEVSSSTFPGIPACSNEDGMLHNQLYDFNGILDTNPLTGEKEDQNGNNRLDPGNVASVTAAITDSTGHGTVSIVYARDYAYWVNVKLEAFANDLKGSTASAYATFDLTGDARDYIEKDIFPPGHPSPFGKSTSCYADLTVTTVSASGLAITWQRSPTANYYRVYRDGISIANIPQNTYSDTGLTGGTRYCYKIMAVDATGTESSFTNVVCNSTAVLPPADLAVTAISPSQIRISWTALTGATGYNIYKNSAATPLKSVVSTSTTDTNLTANTLYCYAVSGYSATGIESAKSSQVCATTSALVPGPPTGLTATAVSATQISLAWVPPAGGAIGYNIYRNRLNIAGEYVGWALLGSVPGSATTVSDMAGAWSNATANGYPAGEDSPATHVQYCYKIAAWNEPGHEAPSTGAVCVSTPLAPPAPTNLTAVGSAGPPPTVTLTWITSAGAVSYKIYRDGTFLKQVVGAQTTDVVPVAATNYCYAISALDASGNESGKSAQSCVATP